jgi:ribosomal RNA small subunit methyltransferase A
MIQEKKWSLQAIPKTTNFLVRRSKQHSLGQNFLISRSVADMMIEYAKIRDTDTVFEIGTGTGVLTERLASKAKEVLSFEIDRDLFDSSKFRLAKFRNVKLSLGNALLLPEKTNFDLCISSLPYSLSQRFVEWLAQRANRIRGAVVLVQKEFADKLVSNPGLKNYRSISVICQTQFKIEIISIVDRHSFSPLPQVLSCIVRLTPKQDLPKDMDHSRIVLIKNIFSFRGRILRAALKELGALGKIAPSLSEELLGTRIEKLTPDDFLVISSRAK